MRKRTIVGLLVIVLCGMSLVRALAAPAMAPAAQALGQISSPRDRASVRGQVPIEGSATHPQFQKYEIHYGPEPNPGNQWTPIGGSPFTVPVVQGRLGLWDTTIIPDGLYSLRLRIVRLDGNYDEYVVHGIQVSNTQPTETPTPRDTATPAGPTDTPQPTLTVVIGVPTMSSPTPKPTNTPLPTASPTVTPEPMNLPFQNTSDAVCWGAGGTLALFVGIGLVFALKGWLVSLFRWLARRSKESLGMYEE
jgi:hypothetical protein